MAATLEVACPHCGGGQPNPDDGGFAWTVDEVETNQGERACVDCDEPFTLLSAKRVQTAKAHGAIDP